MANACVRGTRFEGTLALVLPGLLVGVWLAAGERPTLAKEPAKATPARPAKNLQALAQAALASEQVAYINGLIEEKWAEKKIEPARRAADHTFIRRVTLDLVGRIARPDEIDRFLRDPKETRRSLLIERLLDSEEYAKNWAQIWSVWLLTRAGALEPNQAVHHEEMRAWLEEQFSQNRPYDELVADLLTARGKTSENGAVNFILAHLGEPVPAAKRSEEGQFQMVPLTSRTTRLFLGLQTQCTQCHDHPFRPEEWQQQHFWGVNAFFRQVERKGNPPMRRRDPPATLELTDNPTYNAEGIVFFEKRNGILLPTKPVFLDGQKMRPDGSSTRREELARFILKSEYFPKALVNRLWGHFFGRGLNEQPAVDDFGGHNNVVHEKLLDQLAADFVRYKYDLKFLIRWICNSNPYQLSSVANKTNDKLDAEPFFGRMLLKAMSPEQLFESLMVATQADAAQSKEKRQELRNQWMRNLIVNFGDDEGNEVTFNGTVVQALMMMNSNEINQAISDGQKGTVALLLKRPRGTPRVMMRDLYLVTLNREPTENEYQRILRLVLTPLPRTKDPASVWQDLFWALLNSNEFMLNH